MAGQNEQNVVETSVASSEVAPVSEPVQQPVESAPAVETPKAESKPKAKAKKVDSLKEAEKAQEKRRKAEAKLAEKERAKAAKLAEKEEKRRRGRPAGYTGEILALIVLLLQRFGATGARRRLSAVGGAEASGLERQWRKDTTAAWSEVAGVGKAPVLTRISLPTLLDIASGEYEGQPTKVELKRGRPVKVA